MVTRHGILYSHAPNARIDEHPTRLESLLAGLATMTAQPGIEFELVRDDGNGWRTDKGETPEQIISRRWTW